MSESESSFCSTCSGSHVEDSSGSATDSIGTTLDDDDIQYLQIFNQHLNEELFFVKLLDKKERNDDSLNPTDEAINQLSTDSMSSKLNTNDRLRSSYTRLTSWVFDRKSFGRKKKSFKRKSSKKSEIKNEKQSIDSSKPSISISVCDQNSSQTNSNKLFDIMTSFNNFEPVSKPDTNFILMYLIAPTESSDKDCLVFSYPKYEKEDINNPIILKLKGMFITLSQVVSQMTNQFISLSSVSVNQETNEKLYTIAYVHEFSSLLVLALPQQSHTDIEVEAIASTISRIMKFTYNSMDSAFKNESNHQSLMKLFFTIDYILNEESKHSLLDSIFFNTVKRLLIDDSLAINISDSLTEYEAMDWLSDSSSIDTEVHNFTQFIVIGSCLIFKGFLLSSHLPTNYLKDIYGILATKGLLSLHKNQSIRLVFWNEVFPKSERRNESNDYIENEGVKYFVSIVGFEHLIHCTLVEMPFLGFEETNIRFNEIIINESIKLLKSYFPKIGVVQEIEHCYDMQEKALNHLFSKKDRKFSKSFSSLKDLFSLSSSSEKQTVYHSTNSLSSYDESSISGSVKSYSSPSLQHSLLSQTSSSATSLSQTNSKDMTPSHCCPDNCIYLQQHLQLPENLICYIDIEDGFQVFAGPLMQCQKDVCDQVFKKFTQYSLEISKKLKNLSGVQEFGRTFEMKFPSNFLSPNKIKSKKSDNEICLFNIIGRLESNFNEFYACFKLNTNTMSLIDVDINNLVYKLRLQRKLLL